MPVNSILFLANNKAGKGLPKNFEERLKSIIAASQIEYQILYSTHPGHLTELAKIGIQNGYKTIVVAGGDGSVNEVFKSLVGTDVKFGILPLGSGNGLARHLGIPLNLEKSLDLILKGKSKLIDTATINDQPFISIAGTGFDAFIAMHFANGISRGFWNYFWLVIKHYFSYRPISYQISTNNQKIISKALLISCANSNQFGNNISIAPRAKIDDGYLDITILLKPPLYMLPFTIIHLLKGTINKSKYTKFFKAKILEIKSEVSPLINVDGEFRETSNPIRIKIIPDSINIIVP